MKVFFEHSIFTKQILGEPSKYILDFVEINQSKYSNELSEEIKLKILNKTAVRRIGTPEDIAAASYFLYQSTYITGQVLNVDGGRSLA